VKTKPKTADAQQVKRAMQRAIEKIGKRKRIQAGQFFELLISCINP